MHYVCIIHILSMTVTGWVCRHIALCSELRCFCVVEDYFVAFYIQRVVMVRSTLTGYSVVIWSLTACFLSAAQGKYTYILHATQRRHEVLTLSTSVTQLCTCYPDPLVLLAYLQRRINELIIIVITLKKNSFPILSCSRAFQWFLTVAQESF